MTASYQPDLFGATSTYQPKNKAKAAAAKSGTFVDNMKLPIHRWFRYSAGFSAAWVKDVINEHGARTILDPFAGSGTVCVVADELEVDSYGVESHPFVHRLAKGKLAWSANVPDFERIMAELMNRVGRGALTLPAEIPTLLQKCYTDAALAELFKIRKAYYDAIPHMPEDLRSLAFLAISAILRPVSHVGTAQWQYVLPNKRKAKVSAPLEALRLQIQMMACDMREMQRNVTISCATLLCGDARTLDEIPDKAVDLVVTSPPYANNYDYADATRLEMTFWGEVDSWGDLHEKVRRHLIRSSSQHVSKDRLTLETLLEDPIVKPIRDELADVCGQLAEIRGTKGGNKAYHTMIAAYFADMGRTFNALRRVTVDNCSMCFVIGDSAPYGVHAPVEKWLGVLALEAGFRDWSFEKIRDRNVKWKNRKHTVPLHEGRIWIKG